MTYQRNMRWGATSVVGVLADEPGGHARESGVDDGEVDADHEADQDDDAGGLPQLPAVGPLDALQLGPALADELHGAALARGGLDGATRRPPAGRRRVRGV